MIVQQISERFHAPAVIDLVDHAVRELRMDALLGTHVYEFRRGVFIDNNIDADIDHLPCYDPAGRLVIGVEGIFRRRGYAYRICGLPLFPPVTLVPGLAAGILSGFLAAVG